MEIAKCCLSPQRLDSYSNLHLLSIEVSLTLSPTTLLNFFTMKVRKKLLMYRIKGPLAMLDWKTTKRKILNWQLTLAYRGH